MLDAGGRQRLNRCEARVGELTHRLFADAGERVRKRRVARVLGRRPVDLSGGFGPDGFNLSDAPLPYELAGIGEKTVRRLVEGGFATLEAVGAATVEQLSEIPGIGGKTAEKILAAARGDAPVSEDA